MLTQIGETSGSSWIEYKSATGSSNSIGHLYELVTLVLGFGPFEEGKTMGLAAHGQPTFLPVLEKHVRLGSNMDSCFEADPLASGLRTSLTPRWQRGATVFTRAPISQRASKP